ncbi:MAG TPA: EAL domain-containing protein [Frankiaceae bacterium]
MARTEGAGPTLAAAACGPAGGGPPPPSPPPDGRGTPAFALWCRRTLQRLHTKHGLEWFVCRLEREDVVVLDAVGSLPWVRRLPWVLPFETSLSYAVLQLGAPRLVRRLSDEPLFEHRRAELAHPVEGFVCLPLTTASGATLGTLLGFSGRTLPDDLADAMPDLELTAGMLAALLEQELLVAREIRRVRTAEQRAGTDPLTGLANRRVWDAALHHEEPRWAEHGTHSAVLVVDLDGLKEVNDSYGHSAGDALLRRTADVLSAHVRDLDLVARLGGDEFGVLLTETSAGEAEQARDRLVAALGDARIPASVGLALRRTAPSLAAAWHRADAAMYAEKAARSYRVRPLPQRPLPLVELPRPAVAALLRQVREHLGMEVAWVSQFRAPDQVFIEIDSALDLPLHAGSVLPLEGSYCQRIVAGDPACVLPDLEGIPSPFPPGVELGCYVGVPVRLPDGQLFGTLCTAAREPRSDLGPPQVAYLQGVAMAVATLLAPADQQDERRYRSLARLDRLFADGGPRMHFQPVIDLTTGRRVGQEALARFPDGAAADWFVAAEQVGQGERLETAAIARALGSLGSLDGWLSVNVSPGLLRSPQLGKLLADAPLDRIVLELTEHTPVDDYDRVEATLRPLRAAGLRLAVDDAGAGFASLRHVLQLLPDLLKLDVSLVRGISEDPVRQALAAALLSFAREFGAGIVAEGVEGVEDLDLLRALGVDLAQGYLLGRPRPLPALAGPA